MSKEEFNYCPYSKFPAELPVLRELGYLLIVSLALMLVNFPRIATGSSQETSLISNHSTESPMTLWHAPSCRAHSREVDDSVGERIVEQALSKTLYKTSSYLQDSEDFKLHP